MQPCTDLYRRCGLGAAASKARPGGQQREAEQAGLDREGVQGEGDDAEEGMESGRYGWDGDRMGIGWDGLGCGAAAEGRLHSAACIRSSNSRRGVLCSAATDGLMIGRPAASSGPNSGLRRGLSVYPGRAPGRGGLFGVLGQFFIFLLLLLLLLLSYFSFAAYSSACSSSPMVPLSSPRFSILLLYNK